MRLYTVKFKLYVLIALLALPAVASAQQKTRLIDGWQFLKQDLGGIWEAVRPVGKGNPESVPLWQDVSLPHCVNATDAVDPDVNYYQGPAWYRTTVSVSNPYEGGRILLHFEGAGQQTDVYVYTTKVGEHTGGYDEWSVDITDAVADFKKKEVFNKQFQGRVPVSIRTDNTRNLQRIPSSLSDFNVYGGIYRYLNLVYVPALSVDKLYVKAATDVKGKAGTLELKARFYNPEAKTSATADITITDPSGKVVQKGTAALKDLTGDAVLANYTLKNPVLWSPEKPALYTATVVIHSDGGESRYTERVGFRHFEFVEKGPFMLNGQRLLLRGTHRHEDHADVGAAMTESMMRTEMKMMKAMGVNFIRLGHYQQSRIILDLCDSLGIFVWEEIPWCRGGLGGPVYRDQAKRMLTNMIEQHYNHPAIILWGLGNENDWPGDFPEFDKEKIRAFMTQLNDLSHSLDPSRMTAIRRCDFCKDIVDVYSPSIWAGWYRGIYTEYKSASEDEFNKVKRFLHVEWGGDSHAGRHSENPDRGLGKISGGKGADERAGDASLYGGQARVSKDGDWSESYICNLIDWHLREQETMPWLSGSAYWPFKDFSTPVRPDNPVPYMNQKGVIERDFTPKEAYYVFQSYWAPKLMAHIYGHGWPVRWGDPGEEKMIKVYSNADEAELFLNGKSLGVKKRSSQDFPAAGLRWLTPLTAGENHVRVVVRRGKETVQDEISFRYQTEKWSDPASLKIETLRQENGIATVQVMALDAKNVLCLSAANVVRFGIAGDGELIDNQGTSQGSRVVQLYNGRAVIRVRVKGGQSVVSARVEGLPVALLPVK